MATTSFGGNAAHATSSPNTVTGDSPPRAAPGPKKCGVCNQQTAKYKCPRCLLPYCSVACSRIHKENHPPDAPPPPSEKPAEVAPPQPDKKHHLDFILDEHNRAKLDYLFDKYPGLNHKLFDLAAASDPPQTSGKDSFTMAMEQQAITHITGKKPEPWTEDIGIKRGVAEMRKTANEHTDLAAGVREYLELMRYLLSQRERSDVVETVREKHVVEATRHINGLRQEEADKDGA